MATDWSHGGIFSTAFSLLDDFILRQGNIKVASILPKNAGGVLCFCMVRGGEPFSECLLEGRVGHTVSSVASAVSLNVVSCYSPGSLGLNYNMNLQFLGILTSIYWSLHLLYFVSSGRLGQLGLKEGFPTAVKNISSVIGMFIQHAQDEGKSVDFMPLKLFSLPVLRTWANASLTWRSCGFDIHGPKGSHGLCFPWVLRSV